MKKNINIFIYSISIILLVTYILIFSLILKDDFTYSYQIYYIEAKTAFWYGYDGLKINFDENISYKSGEKGLNLRGMQYLGKDFDFIEDVLGEEETYVLTGVEITKSSTLYFEIPDEEEVIKYKIILEVDINENSRLDFSLNDKKVESVTYECDKYELIIDDIKKTNQLNIKSDRKVKLNNLKFEEI